MLTAAVAVAGLLGFASVSTGGDLVDVVGVSSLPAFVMFVLGVMAVAGEYQHRTITGTFSLRPAGVGYWPPSWRRWRMVGPVVAVVLMGMATVVALPVMWIDGATIDLGRGAVVEAAPAILLAASLFGVLGASLGAIVRNQLVAVVLAVGWTFLGEGIVSIFIGSETARWLPGFAAQAVASHGSDGLPLWTAAALVASYAAVGALIASRLTLTRDIS